MSWKLSIKKMPIKLKLIIGALIPILFVSIFMFSFYPKKHKAEQLELHTSKASDLARILGLSIGSAFEAGRFSGINQTFKWVSEYPEVKYIFLKDEFGRTISEFHANKDEVYTKHNLLKVNRHITYGKNSGRWTVELGYSLDNMNAVIASNQEYTFWVILAIILFSIIISIFLANLILQPIMSLKDAITKFTVNPNKVVEIKNAPENEMKVLSDSFSYMMATIVRNNELIEQRAEDLEVAQQELNAKNQELEEFSYITSHDLQEPLRTINSFTKLLKERYYDCYDDVGKKSLDYLEKASSRSIEQVRAILDFSRLGTKPEPTVIEFPSLFAALRMQLTVLIEESNAEITFPEAMRVPFYGNELELRLLFQNLIVNALKYNTSDIPKIEISYTVSGDYIEFCVSDNGIGIEEQYFDKIFALFQRLDIGEGTGIGLSHCKKIVEMNGGKIWVESEYGKGTQMYFTLKMLEDQTTQLREVV